MTKRMEDDSTRMDYLLAELKKGTTELRQQGDYFHQQMCQMYAILKEVIKEHRKEDTADDSSNIIISNPLLDTISTLTCDSDDYYDFMDWKTDKSGSYIGYAGSVDSGYKSHCPTPEPKDPSTYAPPLNSSFASRSNNKPRIVMGTKLIGRNNNSSRDYKTVSRKQDETTQYKSEENLQFLEEHGEEGEEEIERPLRMVRFSETVKTLSKSKRNRNTLKARKSRSILKDTVNRNNKSVMTSKAGYILEEEIDTILHGKAVYYDLDKVRFYTQNSEGAAEGKDAGAQTRDRRQRSHRDEITKPEICEQSRKPSKILAPPSVQGRSGAEEVNQRGIYHIYEEIIYDNPSKEDDAKEMPPPPPPLPLRPRELSYRKESVPSSANIRNYPKLGSSLYKLVTDKMERLNISLEEEWTVQNKNHSS